MFILILISPSQLLAKKSNLNYYGVYERLLSGSNDSIVAVNKYKIWINNETGYGLLPFNYNKPYIGFYNRSYLQGELDAFIPLQIKIDYNTPILSGLRYTYNLSLDRQKLKDRVQSNSLQDLEKLNQQIKNLQEIKTEQAKKLIYLNKKESVYLNKIKKKGTNINLVSDTLEIQSITPIPEFKNDTSLIYHDSISAAQIKNSVIDTTNKNIIASNLGYQTSTFNLNDSLDIIRREQSKIKSSLDSINSLINGAEKQLKYYEIGLTDLHLAKTQRKKISLQSLKDLNLGLFTPNHQTLMISNTQINGASLEFENLYYLAFIHGRIVDPFILTNTNSNLYGHEFFNPFKSEPGKSISVIKTGIGGLERSHLHFGILFGKNNIKVLNENVSATPFTETIKNTVVELDAQYSYKKHVFCLQVAKSLIQNKEIENLAGNSSGIIESLINNKYSSAFGIKYRSSISKTKTILDFASTYIQPFFKSYANYVHNVDAIKSEVQVNQFVSSKLKLKAKYRREINNIMKFNDYKTDLENYMLGINYRIGRRITLIWNGTPLRYKTTNSEKVISSLFQISNNVMINYIPKSKIVFHNISGSINHFYNSFSENEVQQIYDVSIKDMINFKSDFLLGLLGRYSQGKDINDNLIHIYNISIDGEKKLNDKLALYASVSSIIDNSNNQIHLGYMARSSHKLFKNLDISISFEKYLFYGYMYGTFYNSSLTNPYSFTLKSNVVF